MGSVFVLQSAQSTSGSLEIFVADADSIAKYAEADKICANGGLVKLAFDGVNL